MDEAPCISTERSGETGFNVDLEGFKQDPCLIFLVMRVGRSLSLLRVPLCFDTVLLSLRRCSGWSIDGHAQLRKASLEAGARI
eukprot:1160106-Pelagomonas_calceolata.AAC.2